MTELEFLQAKKELPRLKSSLKTLPFGSKDFSDGLQDFLEAVITVKGHSLSMDVMSERRRMAKLVSTALKDLMPSG